MLCILHHDSPQRPSRPPSTHTPWAWFRGVKVERATVRTTLTPLGRVCSAPPGRRWTGWELPTHAATVPQSATAPRVLRRTAGGPSRGSADSLARRTGSRSRRVSRCGCPTYDTWVGGDRVDRALRFLTLGWVPKDIEGTYEHVTLEMRKQRLEAQRARGRLAALGAGGGSSGSRSPKNLLNNQHKCLGPPWSGAFVLVTHGGRGRVRTADICFVRAALYP